MELRIWRNPLARSRHHRQKIRVIATKSDTPRAPQTIATVREELRFEFDAVGVSFAGANDKELESVADAELKVDIVDDEDGEANDRSIRVGRIEGITTACRLLTSREL